jgi:hypothetical protein
VAAMYSWQHCGTGTLSYRQPRHSVIMDQWNGQQHAFTIKMFYKHNDSLEVAQKEFQKFLFFCVILYKLTTNTKHYDQANSYKLQFMSLLVNYTHGKLHFIMLLTSKAKFLATMSPW